MTVKTTKEASGVFARARSKAQPSPQPTPEPKPEPGISALSGGAASARQLRSAGLLLALGSGVLLGGCCEDGKREMERVADKFGQEAFACCKEIAVTDPVAAQECFQSLKAWRLTVGEGIIEWYQACLEGNRAWADTLLQSLRQLTAEQAAGPCGGTLTLPDGRHATVGMPFGPEDRLSLEGVFGGPFGLLTPPRLDPSGGTGDRMYRWGLDGGRFAISAFGATVEGTLSCDITLQPTSPITYDVVDATWIWTVGTVVTTMRLADPQGESSLRINGAEGHLSLRMSIESPEGIGLLVPPAAWLEVPVRAAPDGFALAAVGVAAATVFPGSLGIADWNGDQLVDQGDWIAYVTTEPMDTLDLRDVNLDGTFDVLDLRLFQAAWREQLRLE